ncbi:hypothetical protein [Methylophaga thiooxydans]|uniref:Mor transcription activator domain-containing protein n=1 Tax=Methylophaga thiooxydans DMS010 TaxID=637616 RepID=C0N311_9GAMM|nr:hypothetical protein [Methylophaga thiooxydans]EEF78965.1 hypothetical protein MDMS009_2482 [Methylophaga thiooxydans DMS010]EEF79720.1 hypothetical protein MDMS009_1658 [Methylophaga thiooxydans DMS010]EEF80083.1 hypothetical protein MDMS009_1240 [Methylophaga thiooxydans DMS010]EEF80261.1 hypothetical protein MDMS009_1157 [Methylophaga thiooxydans DMS010]EEF80392.1 hypothetical protein MDMS009_1005 [Methylophaga thiooxydans DMS010]
MNLPDYLPPVAREIADVIGLDGLLRLVKQFGGVTIRVPGQGDLKQVLSPDQYKQFVHTFRNEKIAIPKLQARLYQVDLAETSRLLDQGFTKAEVARTQKITERAVYKRQAKQRQLENDKQQDLF